MTKSTNVWTESDAMANVQTLFSVALSGATQRIRMDDGRVLELRVIPSEGDAERGRQFLMRGGEGADEDPTDV